MLESTLILTAFLSILIAVLDFSQILFVHQTLVERVRSATRYGALNAYNPDVIQNMVLYGQPADPGTPAFLELTRSMVAVERANPNTNEDRIVVTISNYPFRIVTPFIGGLARAMPITFSLPYEVPH